MAHPESGPAKIESLPCSPGGVGERVYGAAGWSPPGTGRRRARAARHVEAEHRRQLMAQRKAELEVRRRERHDSPLLPAAGEPGTMAGRSWRRLRTSPHRATSEVLAGAYQFLAEEGLGTAGILIGQEACPTSALVLREITRPASSTVSTGGVAG